jgi:hypothetical protein
MSLYFIKSNTFKKEIKDKKKIEFIFKKKKKMYLSLIFKLNKMSYRENIPNLRVKPFCFLKYY